MQEFRWAFFRYAKKKALERAFKGLMVELASDLLIESVKLEMFFLLMHLSSQTDLSLTF